MTATPVLAQDDDDIAARSRALLLRHRARSFIVVGTAALAVAATALGLQLTGFDAPYYVVALGALTGLSYGVLAACLVLVFRVSRVVNFAQAGIGLLAAAVLPLLVHVVHLPWWVAFVGALVVGFILAVLTELVVIRRFDRAPRVVGVVASLGAAAVIASEIPVIAILGGGTSTTPSQPPFVPSFSIGPLLLTPSSVALIVSAPLLLAGLALLLNRTRLGMAIRAAAANPDAARLSGIAPALVSPVAWGLTGVLAAAMSVFFALDVDAQASSFAPETLLPALFAAATARFHRLLDALCAGVFIGVVRQLVLWNGDLAPFTDTVTLVLLLAALLPLRKTLGRGEPKSSWASVVPGKPLPADLAQLWPIRHLNAAVLLVGALVLVLVATADDATANSWTYVVCVAIVALATTLLMSLGGELSLGQFAIAGVGGIASYHVVSLTLNVGLGLLAAAAVSGVLMVLLGLPGLRNRGGMGLTITTLAFAAALPPLLREFDGLLGTPQQPVVGPWTLHPGVPYLCFVLVIAALTWWVARSMWTGSFGRIARATRDNGPGSQAFGIHDTRRRVLLFFLCGALSGVGGAAFVHSRTSSPVDGFPVDLNVLLVLAVVLGGVAALSGGPIGIVWLLAVVQTASPSGTAGGQADTAATMAVYASMLAVMVIAPGGLAQLLQPVRDLVAIGIGRIYGRRHTMASIRGERRAREQLIADPHATPITDPAQAGSPGGDAAGPMPVLQRVDHPATRPGVPIVQASGLTVDFGVVRAVEHLDLSVQEGEILALIGPNGAGKTTTFELLSGFVRPSSGQVSYAGQDITDQSPQERVRLGLVRSFQDAALFPTLTVHEVVLVALERQRRTSTVLSVLGLDRSARERSRVADEVLGYFGLTPFRDVRVMELSTGTRRILEFACLLTLQPRVLLLDEPTSGVAQREVEAMAARIRQIRDDFDLTIVLIEHDIPFVSALADRVVVMTEGHQLMSGSPAEVREDPRVVEAYFGTSAAAIERSDHGAPPFDERQPPS